MAGAAWLPVAQHPEADRARCAQTPGSRGPGQAIVDAALDGAHALATLRQWTDSEQRIRYVYRYHGAMPGRFTSLGAQVQNMKKPETDDVTAAIEAVRTGDLAHMQARYDRPLAIVGDITRALVTPAPGIGCSSPIYPESNRAGWPGCATRPTNSSNGENSIGPGIQH